MCDLLVELDPVPLPIRPSLLEARDLQAGVVGEDRELDTDGSPRIKEHFGIPAVGERRSDLMQFRQRPGNAQVLAGRTGPESAVKAEPLDAGPKALLLPVAAGVELAQQFQEMKSRGGDIAAKLGDLPSDLGRAFFREMKLSHRNLSLQP